MNIFVRQSRYSNIFITRHLQIDIKRLDELKSCAARPDILCCFQDSSAATPRAGRSRRCGGH